MSTLSTSDPRYEAALADFVWTQNTASFRNEYYALIGAAAFQYQTNTLTAMKTYNNASTQRQANYQTATIRRQSTYSSSIRSASSKAQLASMQAASTRDPNFLIFLDQHHLHRLDRNLTKIVQQCVQTLQERFGATVEEKQVCEEKTSFRLPKELL